MNIIINTDISNIILTYMEGATLSENASVMNRVFRQTMHSPVEQKQTCSFLVFACITTFNDVYVFASGLD